MTSATRSAASADRPARQPDTGASGLAAGMSRKVLAVLNKTASDMVTEKLREELRRKDIEISVLEHRLRAFRK
jgi:hypothetical protein